MGLNRKILLMGFDSSQPLLRAVEEGDVIGLIVQDPYRMGYLGTWTLVRHLEGDDVGRGEEQIPIDKVETRQLFEPDLQRQRKIDVPTFGKKKP
jgi:ABC-type sugar transport system substrate-binding protein